jgi:DNA-binding transcriptional LysR family regulator
MALAAYTRLNLSQPAALRQIHALEGELGMRLVLVGQATAHGTVLLGKAQPVICRLTAHGFQAHR